MSTIERVGVSLEKDLLGQFDEFIGKQGYTNRSEAIRDLIRDRLSQEQLANPHVEAIAGVFLVYDHHATKLADKLLHLQHTHLLQVISSTHIHLDHHTCLEMIILRGNVGRIEHLANHMASLKGVKLSRIALMTPGGKFG
ncbi:MAG: nickel-responsive transcriptional regulator NikR [Planctomycetales bacterium]|nr:nickel-responsive transcriptional regulator NikR [Planctomycetales bacterium]